MTDFSHLWSPSLSTRHFVSLLIDHDILFLPSCLLLSSPFQPSHVHRHYRTCVSSSVTSGVLQKGLNGNNGKEDNLEKNLLYIISYGHKVQIVITWVPLWPLTTLQYVHMPIATAKSDWFYPLLIFTQVINFRPIKTSQNKKLPRQLYYTHAKRQITSPNCALIKKKHSGTG